VNQVRSKQLTVRNCANSEGGADLEVTSIALVDSGDVPASAAFGLTALPQLPAVLPPGSSISFEITYEPTTLDAPEQAWLEILSTDLAKSPLEIEVTGSGSTNGCPIATARCSVRGLDGLPSDEVAVDLLQTMECNSDGTVDSDGGAIASYTWTLVRPDSSATSLDSTNEPTTSFFVDSAGTYRVSLNVVDDGGSEACDISSVNVIAQPGEDIAVELFWNTPGDPDQTDEGIGRGTDVDLHFLHVRRGCWDSILWNCHWRNKQPEWGVPGGTTDNPGLDLDDTDGAGPENVNLNNPEDTVYRIGAEYYDDHGYGPSDVTVRVYVLGAMVFERTRRLPESGFFWEVADIAWPSGEVTPLNRSYTRIGDAVCR
jgi:hypothetical protein